jgi:hypothetical protein
MQFGFGTLVNGPLSGPRDLARIVSEGEAIGYDYCTIAVSPVGRLSPYPPRESK